MIPRRIPLPQEFKEKHLQLAIPETKGLWDSDPKVRTPIDAMEKAKADGYDNYEMVVGPDRVDSFKNMATRANPGFKNIEILTDPTLVRDPDLLKQKEGETPTKGYVKEEIDCWTIWFWSEKICRRR